MIGQIEAKLFDMDSGWSDYRELYFYVRHTIEYGTKLGGILQDFNIESLLVTLHHLAEHRKSLLYPFISGYSNDLVEYAGRNFSTGMIRCGKCGAPYRRKHAAAGSKYEKIVWICDTFNTLGKSECTSQQIPEDILWEKIGEAGGLDGIAEIIVPDRFCITFNMKNGTTRNVEWRHRSRSESWTDEMKNAARENTRKRGDRRG